VLTALSPLCIQQVAKLSCHQQAQNMVAAYLKGLWSAKSAVACSHKSPSKSENFMPAIWIASNLFSCSKQTSVQCTTPYQHSSFDMLLKGNIFSADLVSCCIETCCEEATATVSSQQCTLDMCQKVT